MILSSFQVRLLLLAAAALGSIVLPVVSSGCGRSACIVYSKGEYDANASCPLQKDALPYFTDATCPGPVVSVDGEGVFELNTNNADQSFCCYPVTQRAVELDEQRADCIPPNTGGVGGFENGTSVGVGPGGPGGAFGCLSCSQAFSAHVSGGSDLLCGPALDTWFDLQGCVCASSACTEVCELNFCQDAPVTDECATCVSSASSGCSDILQTCSFQ